jgi:hypothetical protein
MRIGRATSLKLAWFAGLSTLAAAAHTFGPGGAVTGLLATLGAVGPYANAVAQNLGAQLLIDSADAAGDVEASRARGILNHDLHRLIGETIVRLLDRQATGASGHAYLTAAAKAFRSRAWMEVELRAAPMRAR